MLHKKEILILLISTRRQVTKREIKDNNAFEISHQEEMSQILSSF